MSSHVVFAHPLTASSVLACAPASASAPPAKGKKRKADEPDLTDPAAPKSKKAKPAPKVTKGRFKGPVDLDKQCGVINDKNLPCSRSLTCKSHSMGAKRAVQGRSKLYDELLLDWNRANNPNFVEPVKRESKKERKEKKDREKRERKQRELEEFAKKKGIDLSQPGAEAQLEQLKATSKKKKSAATAGTGAAANASGAGTTGAGAKGTVGGDDPANENLAELDSEEELESMTKSVRLATDRGLLAVPPRRPLRRRQLVRRPPRAPPQLPRPLRRRPHEGRRLQRRFGRRSGAPGLRGLVRRVASESMRLPVRVAEVDFEPTRSTPPSIR
ncbi:hypothetical protein EVG20_g8841 [Dentipellis fragilis]|uniref:SCA7 domain-containing protein n=1 Tax=Dentipellis fragilis TaxID=205917 RepID=A0A4Y9Y429_9AGAM|nr:hypothetical protein EVG20_g8841 [Dentipellis fragilis]